MKRSLLFIGLAFILAGSLSSCKKYQGKEVYANVPVYMSYEDFRNSFEFQQPQMMEVAGNIFVHDSYILVNELDKGIHILDNTNPQDPHQIGFLKIIGNTQMAVKGNTLYADSFMDLLTIDISNIQNPILLNRQENVLTYALPRTDDQYPIADIDKSQGVVVDWTIEKTNEVSGFMNKFNVKDCADCEAEEVQTKMAVSSRVNLAGSLSQFTIVDDHLYCLDRMDIKSWNISNPQNPVFGGTTRTWQEPETLFPDPNGGYLYVGTTTGMMIYQTEGTPDFPDHQSTFEHARACDPVVVQGDYAYVTVRSGSECGGDINQLQVVDISNKSWPKIEEDFEMYDPHGLGIDGNWLFVCDGDEGLKVFNNTNPSTVGNNPAYIFHDIQTKDVILNNGLAIMIAEDGIYQYDYSQQGSISLVSVFPF